MITLQEIDIDLKRRALLDLRERAARAIAHLAEAIADVYQEAIEVNSANGAAGAFTSDVRLAENFIQGIIGISKANSYVKYLEYGVKPHAGAQYDAHTKAPPVSAIVKWLRKGRIPIPEEFKNAKTRKLNARRVKKNKDAKLRVNSEAIVSFAWAIAISIKRKGRPALRLIEKTALKELANMNRILQGA